MPGLVPKPVSVPDWLNAHVLPPSLFIADAVERAMMRSAEGNHPFVTDLAAEGPWLGKSQVMGMAGSAALVGCESPLTDS